MKKKIAVIRSKDKIHGKLVYIGIACHNSSSWQIFISYGNTTSYLFEPFETRKECIITIIETWGKWETFEWLVMYCKQVQDGIKMDTNN